MFINLTKNSSCTTALQDSYLLTLSKNLSNSVNNLNNIIQTAKSKPSMPYQCSTNQSISAKSLATYG